MLWDKLLPIFSSAARFSTHHLSRWLGEVCTTPARCGHGLLPASSTWPRNRPCPRERPNRGISSAFPKTSFPWCPSRAQQKFKVWKSGAWKCSAELQLNTLRGDSPSHSHQSPVLVALFFHSFEWHTKQRPSVVCTSCPTTATLVSFHLKPWRSRYVLQFSCVRLRRGLPAWLQEMSLLYLWQPSCSLSPGAAELRAEFFHLLLTHSWPRPGVHGLAWPPRPLGSPQLSLAGSKALERAPRGRKHNS